MKKKPNKVKKEVKNKVKKEEIVIQAKNNEEESEEDVVPFKPFGDIKSDSDDDNNEEDDDEWSSKTVDGVDYHYSSDNLLIDKTTAEQIGYLDGNGTIDYIGNGKEIHEKNKIK